MQSTSTKQNRFTSPVLWTSIIAAIALLLKGLGIIDIDNANVSAITNIVLSILVAFGVVNNPTNSAGL
jgi:uncharacterized membrane protein